MPRTIWNGSLSFGLVNVPVSLTSAARDLDLHFRQLHGKDGSPIEQRRFCSKEDVEVDWEEVARGFELDKGKQVVVTDLELATVQPREVDPIYFDHPWFLVPFGEGEGTLRAYRLLVSVMEPTDRAALGRFVMRTKEYLVLVRPRDGLLSLTTMRFHDEVRPTMGIAPSGRKPAKKKADQAVAVIEALAVDWDPERYADCNRERLLKVVKAKQKGKMEALEATLEQMRPKAGASR